MSWRRFVVSVIAALYFGALIGLTFVPGSAANRSSWLWPFAAFVPVGILLVLILGRRRWWAAIAFSVLGSAWIEAAQTVWMPVGYAEAADVLWASSGAVAGTVIALVLTSPKLRSARPAPAAPTQSMRAHGSPRIVPQGGNREIPQD